MKGFRHDGSVLIDFLSVHLSVSHKMKMDTNLPVTHGEGQMTCISPLYRLITPDVSHVRSRDTMEWKERLYKERVNSIVMFHTCMFNYDPDHYDHV